MLIIALGVVAGGVSWIAWKEFFAHSQSNEPGSPYRNVRAGVQYVGDKTCIECHEHEADSFHAHPMGRSFASIPDVSAAEAYDTASHNPFEASGLLYRIDQQERQIVHRESLSGPKGAAKLETSLPVRFALGSGSHGRAYLIDRDGFLFQSPISWYTQRRSWDLSPGYERNNQHFERPITGECLFCHSNYAGPAEHTLNRYKGPVFPGYSIGCERCHGPGELHVAERGRGASPTNPDDTIVNPKHLSPELRESVCQQCHLQGAARIIRRGRQPFDYRPGLPLHLFRSVFVRPEGLVDDKAVSQVEQMYSSKCFQASKGELGCITCHNPHEFPEPGQRIGYYRDRCLKCHDNQSRCSLPLAQRQAQQDNCIACHMPPANTPDIAHTALSDHRIRRRPSEIVAAPRRPPWEALERPLIHFHQDLLSPQDRAVSRDLGVALIEEARRLEIKDLQMAITQLALPLLDEAAAVDPDDLAALEARGHALWLRGHIERALAVFEQVLEKAPNRETSLQAAQTISEVNGNPKEALDYGKRLLAVNPWNSHYHYYQAQLLAARLEWGPAARACQASLKINPANSEVRKLLIRCYVRTSDKDEALREFEVLLALSPAKEHELRAWLASEKP